MSKSFGNYTDPNELMDKFSADSLRFLLLGSPVLNSEDFSLLDKDVADVARKLSMIWNMYDFFTMYAEVDGWEWDGKLVDPTDTLQNPLDKWVISRLHQLIEEVDGHMQAYDLPNALKPMLPFIEDASNWYVRRSRRRFWKSGDDADKNAAYATLHYVLVQLAHVLAPFTPFLSEELYQKLTGGESVHLQDWPEVGHVNELILTRMAYIREVINEGLSQRAGAGIKVRQPLQSVTVVGLDEALGEDKEELVPIIAEELNVKEVVSTAAGEQRLSIATSISPELKREGLMREVVRNVQSARKQAGLNVDDRIVLSLDTDDSELAKALKEHETTIAEETLATSLKKTSNDAFKVEVSVEGKPLTIYLERSA